MESPEAERLTRTARHWGTRPSLLLRLEDDVIAFALDEALAASDLIADRKAAEKPARDESLRPDERYSVDEDYDDAA